MTRLAIVIVNFNAREHLGNCLASLAGSPPTTKTIGMVSVAAFAARAGASPPLVTMTATWRRTRSAASAGN